jgi:hypothetical protein
VSPTGIPSGEGFGGSQVNPGTVTVAPLGIPSQQAVGEPVMSTGNNLVAAGIDSGEAFGTAVVGRGPVTFTVAGTASAEAFGTPRVSRGFSPPGIASEEAFGAVKVNLGIAATGIPSAEAFGTTWVDAGFQEVFTVGIPSAEAFGGSQVNPGTVSINPLGIPTAHAMGGPTLTVGPVGVIATGIASAEAFGTAQVKRYLLPTGIVSEETFGMPVVIPPEVPEFMEFVASAFAVGGTLTLPPHLPGDLLLAFSYRDGNDTAPSNPVGWTSWAAEVGSNFSGSRMCYRWALTGTEACGTFNNSSALVVLIYRGVGDWFRYNHATGTGGTIVHPIIGADVGESWIVRFAGQRNATNLTSNPPAGSVLRGGIADQAAGFDTNGPVAVHPVPPVNQSTNGSQGWSARVVEIMPPAATKAEAVQDDFDTGSDPDPALWSVAPGDGGVALSGGMLVLTAGTGLVQVTSQQRVDLHESSITFQVMSPIQAGQTGLKYIVAKGRNASNYVRWSLLPTGMRPSGSGSAIGTLLTGHLPGHWYRIRANHKVAYFDYSTDGVNWTNNASTNFYSNSRVLNIGFVMSGGTAGVDTFMIDNLNMT